MSRIAGLVSGRPIAERAWLLGGMLAASREQSRWRLARATSGEASLGSCGGADLHVADEIGVVVAIDGAIYNRGALGRASSDANLVAHLYRAHGFAGAVGRVNGDFAIALHDPATSTLWLARDRFGVRPLYYAAARDGVAFASRLRALLTLPSVSREVDLDWAARFAVLPPGYDDTLLERSPFRGIAQLPAAHVASVTARGITVQRYWDVVDLPDLDGGEADLAAQCRELLIDAMRLRVRAAARPAVMLSGDILSASVQALATLATGNPVRTFADEDAGCPAGDRAAVHLARGASSPGQRAAATGEPDVLAAVGRLIERHDEPVATATSLAHHAVCEAAAADGHDVLLGDVGGDEVSAASDSYLPYFLADLRAANEHARLGREIDAWAALRDGGSSLGSNERARRAMAAHTDPAQPGRCRATLPTEQRYLEAVVPSRAALAHFEPVLAHPFPSYLKNRTYQALTRETAPRLRAEDRNASASGLRNAFPFLDHRVVEWLYRIPGTMKIRDGVGAALLRRATHGLVHEPAPRPVSTGRTVPGHVWYAAAGRAALLDLIGSQRFRERSLYDVAATRRLVDEDAGFGSGSAPGRNHAAFLWQLVNLELWFRWLDSLPPAPVDGPQGSGTEVTAQRR